MQVNDPVSHTLWNADYLIAKNGGKAPISMSSFTSLVRNIHPPSKPVDAPQNLPACPDDLSCLREWLWNGTGLVPSAADLELELPQNGAGSPFQERSNLSSTEILLLGVQTFALVPSCATLCCTAQSHGADKHSLRFA